MTNVQTTQLIVKGLNLIVRGTVDGVEYTVVIPREGATDESVKAALLQASGKTAAPAIVLSPRQAELVRERVEEELAPEDIDAMKSVLGAGGFMGTAPVESAQFASVEFKTEEEKDDLEEKSKVQLYGIAKTAGVQNAYRLSKDELVKEIRKARRK